jgi:hypothetical protein
VEKTVQAFMQANPKVRIVSVQVLADGNNNGKLDVQTLIAVRVPVFGNVIVLETPPVDSVLSEAVAVAERVAGALPPQAQPFAKTALAVIRGVLGAAGL